MTQLATPDTALGEFDDTTIVSEGLAYRVFEEHDELWAELPDPEELMYVVQGGKKTPVEDIPRVKRRVVMSTGSHHYQTYWVAGDKKYGNLLQTLPLVYLRKDRRWIPREEAFMRPRESTRMITQWNHHCIRCHSTGGNPGLFGQGEQSGFNTRVGELGISCEACHGPGRDHVTLYRDPSVRYSHHLTGGLSQRIVNPEKLDHKRSSQVCGQCHSVFIMNNKSGMKYAYQGIMFRPGGELEETRYQIQHPRGNYSQAILEDYRNNRSFYRDRWWDDGTILAGGREYTALSASACFQKGELGCMSCHTMHHGKPNHQLKSGMDTSLACISCHNSSKFTTDVSSHTHHEAGSEGSNCLNCHMPQNTYALFSALRSHQIVSPSVESSIKYETPNACNLCHLDKTLAWTEDYMVEWYGAERSTKEGDQEKVAAGPLWMLKGNAAMRAIVAWHAGWEVSRNTAGDEWRAAFLSDLLKDDYGVVRYVAFQSLRKLPGFSKFEYDFLAPPSELVSYSVAAMQTWEQEFQESDLRDKKLLINDKGALDVEAFKRLLSNRDNRPIYVKE